MRSIRLMLMVLFPLLVLASCATMRRNSAVEQERTTLRVENRSWSAVNVYAIRGGQRVRLGMVTATTTQVLVIPPTLISGMTTLRFVADPIGSDRAPVSDEITITPGDQVTLYIPNT